MARILASNLIFILFSFQLFYHTFKDDVWLLSN